MSFFIKNVSVKKNDSLVLNNISFQDSEVNNWVIVGNSGSGKSTFLDLLGGKIFPSNGNFFKDTSKKIVQVSRDYAFHKIVGAAYQYYQQRYNAFDAEIGPTVYQVLQNQVIPLGTIDMKSVELPVIAYNKEKLMQVAKQFKVENLLDRKVTSLSNGETRRTLLAYWFLKSPDILLLDNPFTGLDANSRNELRDILESLTDVQIILVANQNDIPTNFKHLIHFENGEISYCGETCNFNWPKAKTVHLFEDIVIEAPLIENFTTAVKLVNVNVKYANTEVLSKLSWEVKRGECWAVLGPNGSGKSTLMSLITGDNPQAYRNEIYLFDKKRGSGESIWEIKKKIGFVSPELHLYFAKSTPIWKVIASGYYDTMGLFQKIEIELTEKINLYLQIFDLLKYKNTFLSHLSTGQQRLVFLIRALIKNPPLLILDEPCQGLDYNQMVFFREMLNKIVLTQNKTLIYITHYLDEIPQCVNKKLYLENGQVIKIEN